MNNWRAILVLLSVGLILACQPSGGDKKVDSAAEDKAPEPVPVEIANVGRGSVSAVYVGTATLEADGEAEVKAKVGGEITGLLVEEGDVVKAGQAIAKVDAAQLTLELARAKANVDKVNREYQRNIELHEKGLLPAGTFESVKFDLDALQATYKLTQLQLSYTTIKAPISGVISARHVKVGNNIAVGETLFTITDLEPLIAYLHVPEVDFQKLSASQRVDLLVDAIPNKQFSGEIARISPVVDASTGTFKVTIEVDDGSNSLKPGMFGRVSIVYETFEDAVLLPRNAVVDTDGRPTVFVVDGDTAKQTEIETGHINGQNIQVVRGLDGNEQVVVVGQNGLKHDGLIKIIGQPSDSTEFELKDNSDTALASKSE